MEINLREEVYYRRLSNNHLEENKHDLSSARERMIERMPQPRPRPPRRTHQDSAPIAKTADQAREQMTARTRLPVFLLWLPAFRGRARREGWFSPLTRAAIASPEALTAPV
jgi:hypothetical protein